MPTPQTQRSTYKDRRINVMLHENAEETVQGAAPGTVRAVAIHEQTPRKTVFLISLATAVLCAVVMFFLLFRHDSSHAVKNVPNQPVQTASVNLRAPASAIATPSIPSRAVAPQTIKAPIEIQRVHFKLKRSARSQTVGPLSLRLISTNVRKGLCNISITAAKMRTAQRQVQVNRSIQVRVEDNETAGLMISGISKDSVSGYVTGR